jgi:hypothetical protein
MSGKELSKLVAFVKGTQFDLVVRKDTHTLNFFLHDIFYCKAILIFLTTIYCRSISKEKDMDVLAWRTLLQGLNYLGKRHLHQKTLQCSKSFLFVVKTFKAI